MFLRNLIRTKTFSFSSTVDMDWSRYDRLQRVKSNPKPKSDSFAASIGSPESDSMHTKYESLRTVFKGMDNWWWYQITAIIVKAHQTWMKPPICLAHWKPPKLRHCWNCKKLAKEAINAGAQCREGLRMTRHHP